MGKTKSTKREFFEVSAPITATKIELYAATKEELTGKTIKLDLTKSLRGKNLELTLRILNENGKLVTRPEKTELTTTYIHRVMRKSTDYIEDSFETTCRDATARIKPFFITRRRVSRAVLKALRNAAHDYLQHYTKTRTIEELFSDVITNKLQKQLAFVLKKVYPLALCEIRIFELVKKKATPEKEE